MGTIKGDLDVLGLADLLQILVQHRKIGTLTVHDQYSRKLLYFGTDGMMMLSTGERKGPRLGEMLLLTRQLSFPQVARALEGQKQWSVHFGEAVVRLGYLPRETIFEAILIQVEEEICDMFFWTGAAFEFVQGPPPPIFEDPEQPVAILKRDVSGLILEAMRRLDEWRTYDQMLGGGNAVYGVTDQIQSRSAEYTADPVIPIVVQAIDGQRAIDDVVTEAGVSRFLVYSVLARLLQDGCLQRVGATGTTTRVTIVAPSAAAAPPPPKPPPAEPAAAAQTAAPAAAAPATPGAKEPAPEPAAPAPTKRLTGSGKTRVTKRMLKEAKETRDAATPAGPEPPLILLLSANPRNRQILGDALKGAGCQTVGTSQESSAVDALKRRPVQLVVIEAPLPPRGVKKAIAELKQATGAPIVVLMPSKSTEDYAQILQAGARECFVKTLPADKLLEGIKRHLKPPAGA
jgi:CheY-like chemotaxis protein